MRGAFLCAALVAAAWPAGATTIISQSVPSPCCDQPGLIYASWTQTSAWSNVAITADLFSQSGTATGTAYLTNQVGAGTTALSNQIATAPISIANTTPQFIPLFSGLTLNAGTYYLVINPISNLNWASNTLTPTVASGVTANSDNFVTSVNGYPPASTFNDSKGTILLYTVTGTQGVSVPALSTWALFGTVLLLGLSGLMLVNRYRQIA